MSWAVLMLHIILCYVPVAEKMTAVDEILRVVRGCITHTGYASSIRQIRQLKSYFCGDGNEKNWSN